MQAAVDCLAHHLLRLNKYKYQPDFGTLRFSRTSCIEIPKHIPWCISWFVVSKHAPSDVARHLGNIQQKHFFFFSPVFRSLDSLLLEVSILASVTLLIHIHVWARYGNRTLSRMRIWNSGALESPGKFWVSTARVIDLGIQRWSPVEKFSWSAILTAVTVDLGSPAWIS